MTDDPFARAAARVDAAEDERAKSQRGQVQRVTSSWARTGFRIHASVYVAVNLLLIAIYVTTTPGGIPWPLYVALAWGVGLAAHYAAVGGSMRPRR